MMTPTILNLPTPPAAGAPSSDSALAAEPGDLLSAEFAAMFAALCAAQQPAPPVTDPVTAEVTETPIELTPEITLKSEVPTVLFEGPKVEVPVEFEAPVKVAVEDITVEGEVLLQTASIAYNPNTVTTKGAIVAPRETRISQVTVAEDIPVLPKIEAPVGEPAKPSETLEVATDELPLPAPPPEATLSEEAIEIKSATTLPVVVTAVPSKGRPVPVMGNPLPNQEPAKTEVGATVTETVTVETDEPLKVKPQTEATQRISNLIATYLVEGAQNGSRPTTARFAGLDFELELDPAARQKRQAAKADVSRTMDLSLHPFSDLIADAVTQTKDPSPVAQVSQRVMELARTSTREVESLNFRLNPKELGEVELKLTRHKDGSISAHLTTERETARVSLTRSVDELRQSLEQAGVQVAKLQVSSSTTSMDTSRRHERDTAANSDEFRTTTTTNSNEPEASNTSLANHDRLLSLRA
jgi:flagellar hook-length control protein FliK